MDCQNKIGLHLANKLTKRHINFREKPMNVTLAVQVLSNSVSVALKSLTTRLPDQFKDIEGTANFCKIMNDIFDMLNVRAQFSKRGHCLPLTRKNEEVLKERATQYEQYISQLTCTQPKNGASSPTKLIASARKTGFLANFLCFRNVD